MQLLIVSLGGALGAVSRWKLGGLVLHHTADWKFPVSTFLVNCVGCAVAGILAGLATKQDWFSTDARLLLFTGLLGGFTTFSAFSLETVMLLRRGEFLVAILYVVLSIAVAVTALGLAMWSINGRAAD